MSANFECIDCKYAVCGYFSGDAIGVCTAVNCSVRDGSYAYPVRPMSVPEGWTCQLKEKVVDEVRVVPYLKKPGIVMFYTDSNEISDAFGNEIKERKNNATD